jgi:outer membrane protein insertion porin family
MKFVLRLCLFAAFLPLFTAWGQIASPGPKILKVEIKHVGPQAVSDELIRSNIRVKPGDAYRPLAVDDDVRNLYTTGFFYNIQVTRQETPDGWILTYVLQANPKVTDIKIVGNTKYSDSTLRKKLTSKIGDVLDQRKLFNDEQEILKRYQKAGYPRTKVDYAFTIEQDSGRAIVTITVTESPKMKIVGVEFVGARAFSEKKLRKVIKTRKHWMFSWITTHGFLKDEELDLDKDRLRDFYRDNGYIDFDFKRKPDGSEDVEFINPSPRTLIVRFNIYEGTQYRVGSVKFTGNKLFTTNEITAGLRQLHGTARRKTKPGPHGLEMDVGDIFKMKGLAQDTEAIEDFYGSRGYIDVTAASRNLNVIKIPNTEAGTMDLEFQIEEGPKYKIEKIEIRGNTHTKDRVIRRELAVAPGENFDMVRVKISKQRIEGLDFFEPGKVDARPEPTDPPISGRKNLVIGVEEKNTGSLSVGAAFSSVDAIVGFAEFQQRNFDLFNPPNFTGGGQKFRLRVQLGTERKDVVATFIEPWFLEKKLSLTVELYHRELSFESLESIYDENRTGFSVGLSRALGSDFLIGSINYTLEDVGIFLNSGFHDWVYGIVPGQGPGAGVPGILPPNVPDAILQERGNHLLNRFRAALAYDTRNSVQLPDKGQKSEISGEIVGGDRNFYKIELHTAWYFRGFYPGHVLELVGHGGVAGGLGSNDVPFYDRYYLGGLYSLRGYRYRSVSPRQLGFDEPIGGDTYWFASAEYSIPIFQQEKERGIGVRLAAFYDIGSVGADPYDFNAGGYDDNWGIGLRLNLPIGPLRLDYGVPIHHDQHNSGSGRFQFGVGYTRDF